MNIFRQTVIGIWIQPLKKCESGQDQKGKNSDQKHQTKLFRIQRRFSEL